MASAMDIQRPWPLLALPENSSTPTAAGPPRLTKRPLSLSVPQDDEASDASAPFGRRKLSRCAGWTSGSPSLSRRAPLRQSPSSSPPPPPPPPLSCLALSVAPSGVGHVSQVGGHQHGSAFVLTGPAHEGGSSIPNGVVMLEVENWAEEAPQYPNEMPGVGEDAEEAMAPGAGTGGGGGSVGGGGGGGTARCRPSDAGVMDTTHSGCSATTCGRALNRGRIIDGVPTEAMFERAGYAAGVRGDVRGISSGLGGWFNDTRTVVGGS